MDFFDWALEEPEHPVDDCALSRVRSDESGGESFWNDYYALNQFGPPETATSLQSSNSSFIGPEISGKNPYVSQSDSSTVDESRRGSAATSSQGYSLESGRDPLANRIIRRRTQNRNSQRIYRQRRVEERKRFEDRANSAEEASEKLVAHVKELKSVVKSLETRIELLEAENVALRSSTSSMPWRQSSAFN